MVQDTPVTDRDFAAKTSYAATSRSPVCISF